MAPVSAVLPPLGTWGKKESGFRYSRKPDLVRGLSAREFDYPYGLSVLDFLRVLSVPSEAPV